MVDVKKADDVVDTISSFMPQVVLAASLAQARMDAYRQGFEAGLKFRKKRLRKRG